MVKGKKLSHKERKDKLERDETERRRLFKALCAHVGQGLSIGSFSECHDDTLRDMLKRFPHEFDREELEIALREGKKWWETVGKNQALGTCMGNSRTWYYNMTNRYGWTDKAQIDTNVKGEVSVSVISYASKKPLQASVNQLNS